MRGQTQRIQKRIKPMMRIFVQILTLGLSLIFMPPHAHAQELPSPGRQAGNYFFKIPQGDYHKAGKFSAIDCLKKTPPAFECERGIYSGEYIPYNSERIYSLCFKGRGEFSPQPKILNNSPRLVYFQGGFLLVLEADKSQENQPFKWHQGETVTPIICPRLQNSERVHN